MRGGYAVGYAPNIPVQQGRGRAGQSNKDRQEPQGAAQSAGSGIERN